MFNKYEITGRTRTHIKQIIEPRFAGHPEVVEAFLELREAAAKDGIDLIPFSSFRDFKTQLRIWNHKFSGKKPLYDRNGRVRDFNSLGEEQLIWHILDWSALPGGSRHQWGTEIDVVDKAVMPEGYEIKLLPEEVEPGGLFHPLHGWLDQNISRFGFFRPYKYFQGGMFPELWHLSYAPISMKAIEDLSVSILEEVLAEIDILGKELVLKLLPEIYEKHILNYVKPEHP